MRREYLARHSVLGLALMTVAGSHARAQIGSRGQIVEPTAAQVASSLRNTGNQGLVLVVLTQAQGPRSARVMDEIADTLVAIAATLPGDDHLGVSTRMAATQALFFAGRGSTGMDFGAGGVPYAGAAVRLMRLSETAQDLRVCTAALLGLVRLSDSTAHLQFLARIARESKTETAQTATELLVNETGAAGQVIARELYLAGSVTQWSAKRTLDVAAHHFGWRRP